MKIDRIHHVAYRCRDARETVLWYERMLKMDFVLAIAEDFVPSTRAPDPYMHVFLDAGGGNVLAFFKLPTQPPMARDPNTPEWVQLCERLGERFSDPRTSRSDASGVPTAWTGGSASRSGTRCSI